MPVKMLSIPAMMNRAVSTALPMARLPVLAAILMTLKPKMRPITSKIPPASPKKNRGLLSEIMTISRLRTSTPCLMGLRVEPSLVYMFEIGTSVILSFLSAARVIISDSMANPVAFNLRLFIAFGERARKPDSESEILAFEASRAECKRTFRPMRRYLGVLSFWASLEPMTRSKPSEMGLMIEGISLGSCWESASKRTRMSGFPFFASASMLWMAAHLPLISSICLPSLNFAYKFSY